MTAVGYDARGQAAESLTLVALIPEARTLDATLPGPSVARRQACRGAASFKVHSAKSDSGIPFREIQSMHASTATHRHVPHEEDAAEPLAPGA